MAECRDSGIPADGAINNTVEAGSSYSEKTRCFTSHFLHSDRFPANFSEINSKTLSLKLECIHDMNVKMPSLHVSKILRIVLWFN